MEKLCKVCGKKHLMLSYENTCYSCQEQSYNTQISQQLQNDEITKTECEGEIYCPYCGRIYERCELRAEMIDGNEYELCCDSCEREFAMTASVTVDFSTRRLSEMEEET